MLRTGTGVIVGGNRQRVATAWHYLWTFGTGSVVGRLLYLGWLSINVVIGPIDPE
jgi:hypothetical protein